MAGPIHFPVTVDSILRHSHDVATFWLTYAGRRPHFRPGQFIHLAIDPYDPSSHWPESRIFSIASSPSNTEGMRLTISRQGRFTSRLLDTVCVGQMLWGKGPYGDFEVRTRFTSEEIVLVAGGTGITPFCAFMEKAFEAPNQVPGLVTLHYGARTPELLVYRELAERCCHEVPGFRAVFYVEQAWDGSLGAVGGRPDGCAVFGSCTHPASNTYYLSGPKAMLVALTATLTGDFGVSPARLLSDVWE